MCIRDRLKRMYRLYSTKPVFFSLQHSKHSRTNGKSVTGLASTLTLISTNSDDWEKKIKITGRPVSF